LAHLANAIAFQIATKQAGTWGSPAGLSKMQLNAVAVKYCSQVHRSVGSRHPILAPFGLLCFSPIELPVSSVSVITCCRQVTAGGGGGKKRGCWIGLNPNECPKTHLEVHLGDIVEPFVQSGFAVARREACECHFWQYRSRLGVHLRLHVRMDTRYAGRASRSCTSCL
jgi:hypothetical protein